MLADINIKLAFGENGIEMKLGKDWNVTVVEPFYIQSLPDASKSILQMVNHPLDCQPLQNIIEKDNTVGIIFNDLTRPTPTQLIIETLISDIKHVPNDSIILFNALGTHRHNTEAELRSMLGDFLVDNFRIVQNNAFDKNTQVFVGKTSSGNEVWLNRELVSCDVRILTGFIEPHFFAGFSGGGKAIMPGMAGFETIIKNHNSQNIGDPNASWGITKGNPIWEEVREVLSMTGFNFLVNITLNRDKEITAVFAGDPVQAHDMGIEFVRQTAMVPVPSEFDVVVTTNSGFPLDLNLYQSVKGMSAAARIIKNGGVIIAAADCWDGIPEHGLFGYLLENFPDPATMLEEICSPSFSKLDQWQAQIFAQIQLKADIYIYTKNLSDEQLIIANLKRCNDIHDLIEDFRRKKGKDISICILPEGPQTIPYIDSGKNNI